MHLSTLRNIYDAEGPFATVYLEGGAPTEEAGTEVRLAWDDLRRSLAESGATDHILNALDDALIVPDIGEVKADGRALVANAEGVLLNDSWDATATPGRAAYFTSEPELGAYVREQAMSVRLLVAIASQKGALIRRVVASPSLGVEEGKEQVVGTASDESVHKPREGGFSHNRIQRRADEAVKQNVREVAEHLGNEAERWHPDLVVLAGEVQGRTALRDELPKALEEIHREAEAGGIDDEAAEEALATALRGLASDFHGQRTQQHTDRFEQARGHNQVAEGADNVRRAAEMGAVETLLLSRHRVAPNESHLLAACARVDAGVALIETGMQDAVAAVLRFEAVDEITG